MRTPRKTASPRAPEAQPPRRRRTAVEARAAILDAAERTLVSAGPAAIRLQEVAAAVGVSHPTVLHHFGSREALVREVCELRFAAIHADLVTAIAASNGGADELGALLGKVLHALEAQGHGRVVFWLALEGLLGEHDQLRLRDVAQAAHALRHRKRGGKPPPLDDTRHVVVLAALALLAESVLGGVILRDAGLGEGDAARARFRGWFARLLAEHLANGPAAETR